MNHVADTLDDATRRLVTATQAGLPLTTRPFEALATRLGVSQEQVLECFADMIDNGSVRRIAAVPNHYALGFRANGMSVWDVADEDAITCGREIGSLPFVSHCYLRPRHLPDWPYNLFAMVHGHCRAAVEAQVESIAEILGTRARARDVLYSKRILKKTGMRLAREA
jgi:DNA-binding Lrp family transcriptional regulator